MSRHNYTNPAFCQQSEFYSPPAKVHRSGSVRSLKQLRIGNDQQQKLLLQQRFLKQQSIENVLPPKPGPKPPVQLQQQTLNEAGGAGYNQTISNNIEQNSVKFLSSVTTSNATSTGKSANTVNNNSGRYALVPVEEISNKENRRYAVLDSKFIHSYSARFTKSQDNIDRSITLSEQHQQSNYDESECDDTFKSLPPIQSSPRKLFTTSPIKTTTSPPRLKSAFSTDFTVHPLNTSSSATNENVGGGSGGGGDGGIENQSSLILIDQKNQQRYAIVPTDDDEEIVDSNHEIIQMKNKTGRTHRYAMIPTNDDDDDDENEDENHDREDRLETSFTNTIDSNSVHNYATIREPSSTVINKQHHQLHRSTSKLNSSCRKLQIDLNASSSTNQLRTESPSIPPKSLKLSKQIATQKLHEFLQQTPPQKKSHQYLSTPSMITKSDVLKTPPSNYSKNSHLNVQTFASTPMGYNGRIVSSTPKQKSLDFSRTPIITKASPATTMGKHHQQQHPKQLKYNTEQLTPYQLEQLHKRTTAIITPRLASLSEGGIPIDCDIDDGYSIAGAERSGGSIHKSWNSFQKIANATATIGVVSLMLIICGIMNSGLCLYMLTDIGKFFYLDIGIISGFAAIGLGTLGFRSRHCDWLPNRNYISGYILVTVFSFCNCFGLLVLLGLHPIPGTPLHDLTTGIVLGLSSLILLLISLGVITSRWCRSPPPDNRVDVY